MKRRSGTRNVNFLRFLITMNYSEDNVQNVHNVHSSKMRILWVPALIRLSGPTQVLTKVALK